MNISLGNIKGALADEIRKAATFYGIKPDDFIRKCIKLGLVVFYIEMNKSAEVIIRDEKGDRVLTLGDTNNSDDDVNVGE